MDTKKIQGYFSKPDKLLLGVCEAVSQKTTIPTLAIRVVLLIITLIFIPFGILLYLLLYLVLVSKKGKAVTFSLSGALLGIPMSYYFQPERVKIWRGSTGVFGYVLNFPTIIEQYHEIVGNGWLLLGNMLLSILIFTALGGLIGNYIEKSNKNSQS